MSDYKKALEQFDKIAQQLFLHENKKYTAGLLLPRFKEAANRLRHDATINQAAYVLEQVAQKDPAREVTSSDLKDLGQQFYQNGTEYNNEFSDLLDQQETKVATETNRLDFNQGIKDIALDGAYQKPETDIYSDDLDASIIVDPTIACTPDELALVKQAAQLIDHELKNTGKVSRASSILKVSTPGQYIFQTTLRTASSESEVDVFIPVEINNSVPHFPTVMSTTERVYTLDHEGLDELTADVNAAIQYKRANSASSLRTAEDYQMTPRQDSMGKYSEEIDEFDLPTQQVSLGHDEIEKVLSDAVLATDSQYTEQARSAGRELVETELKDLGYSNSQVRFNGDYQHGLTYEASVNTAKGKMKIITAVENNNSIFLPPTQFQVAGEEGVYALTQDGIEQVARSSKDGVKEEVHPFLFSMSYPDLKKQLKTAAHSKQHKLAQQIINLIDEKFGDHYRNTATDDYQTWLEESNQSYQSRCGGCNYYTSKTAHTHNDYCNLVKTAAKNVQKDEDLEVCTRSTFDDSSIYFDNGQSIKINWED